MEYLGHVILRGVASMDRSKVEGSSLVCFQVSEGVKGFSWIVRLLEVHQGI